MKFSRMPESRGAGKLPLIGIFVIAILVVGAIVSYVAVGFGSDSDQAGQLAATEGITKTSFTNNGSGTFPKLPAAALSPTPAPAANVKLLAPDPGPAPKLIPEVQFGEVLAEGNVNVDFPGDLDMETWYTFQVDTYSKDITLFFAVYNQTGDTIINTVEVRDYTQGAIINNAEITMFYPDGSERLLKFDSVQGTIGLAQRFSQPYGPSMFSPELRVALVNYGLELSDGPGSVQASVQLDLSGVSDSESITLIQSSPEVVNEVMLEIQELIDQIENKRSK